MSDFLGLHGTALALREQRLQLLSANIANADTPGYQAQDLDFNSALGVALQAPGAGGNALEGGAALGQAGAAAHFYRPSSQPSLDGNTVDGDRENAAFAQATLEYRASLSFIESRVRSMLTAITGQ
ncbi:flagellar basal body rod protein FlgB [Pseudoxanthomonas spadix]|jgi:flagellar basal-body rod protein FlgB|uniref:Flagellar basal body rod protein FlgB n=1 Tax=Pseudoxanthomonas spadix (strain BD-a59) TaxID=1045855 RepID=G7UMZ4_PSEUP|nr:flagellar basal body rod protein FlgB [Pseudoxanthomonas spadix]AER55305.1 flagellar basal body rod protein FlgB [Pseudoxanthomonas spadix BD-a59]MBP3975701.1 flagellar basal body rod protein FlgB [Pseudoxanthomonas spadix]RMW95238.1 flagellar basal body rod protein FlgB [Pseudoxanthomonas spadix]